MGRRHKYVKTDCTATVSGDEKTQVASSHRPQMATAGSARRAAECRQEHSRRHEQTNWLADRTDLMAGSSTVCLAVLIWMYTQGLQHVDSLFCCKNYCCLIRLVWLHDHSCLVDRQLLHVCGLELL